ncbi:MAG: hypothetical protein ABIH83_01145 [Candidatus Micrarchaeota archaeon]
MKKVELKFENEGSAKNAGKIISMQLEKIGKTKTNAEIRGKDVEIKIEDEGKSNEKAAYYAAKRLGTMLSEIDKQI